MPRPKTKSDLIITANTNYKKLNQIISEMPDTILKTPFDFTADTSKKEAHWRRDKNLRDVLVHLYEWHQLLLNWVTSNSSGRAVTFIPAPYNWKTYGDMNIEFWQKHKKTTLATAKQLLEQSHSDIMKLAQNFSDTQLFTKGIYTWVGGSTLGSYFISTTSSHYDWAIKKLKAHIKNCNK